MKLKRARKDKETLQPHRPGFPPPWQKITISACQSKQALPVEHTSSWHSTAHADTEHREALIYLQEVCLQHQQQHTALGSY